MSMNDPRNPSLNRPDQPGYRADGGYRSEAMSGVNQRYYWKCQPQKGGECSAPTSMLPANPLPGGEAKGMPWLRIGLHRDHEANFWLRERWPEPDIGIPLGRLLREGEPSNG